MPAGESVRMRILLYDADCGFCRRWCDWARRRGADSVVTFQSCVEERSLRALAGILEDDCAHAAFLVEVESGRVMASHRAAAAINAILSGLPGPRNVFWRILGRLYRVPGLKQIEDWGYDVIARNRHRLGGTSCNRPS